MIQLIITIVTIALTAALLAASINYLPWWHKPAQEIETVVRSSLLRIESAYEVLFVTGGNAHLAPQSGADGGFENIFRPVLELMPAAPGGFAWSYGQQGSSAGVWSNLPYVCLSTNEPNEAAWKGILRAKSVFSAEQFIVGTECGATTNVGALPASSLAVTYYLLSTPGVDL